ncbi:TlpA family protein disulfide reductase [Mucilaginibacter mali]|uniref:TlpA family protein disulfide reductase n=1 Tax=Mucilaginibacter mali TaxID=2740462 RepID=A0A7D4UGE1_9SPHI|nr:TlpA disulfide reductase family protein [Mucilaginibacter mali]QKJ31656.1 TlpA family protein disulfide reductase [Mucilaginibacter mali]
MKKIIIILTIIITALQSFAQFKISGRVMHPTKGDSLTLNLPFVYGFYHEDNISIPVDKSGRFSINIPVKGQKFGTISWQGASSTVLLTPGRQLTLLLDTGGKFKTFGGTAGGENRLLNATKLAEVSFITKGSRQTSPYAKLSNVEIKEQVVKPWLALRDEHLQMVQAAKLSAHDKALIASEIKYHTLVELDYFARGIMNTPKQQVADLLLDIFDGVKPEPEVFPAGPQYYLYAGAYLSYMETKVFSQHSPNDEQGKRAFLDLYKISLDSATALVKQNGKPYIKWYLLKEYFSRKVAEQYLAQAIYTQWHDKDLSHVEPMMRDMQAYFPASKYLPVLHKKVDALNIALKQNELNKQIQVFAGYEKVNSVYDVISTLKGKVVYLDIWGTWCPACKDDLKYVPKLKARFKDKNVVFVYLDMDDDVKDAQWKTFIKVNGLTGIHLRKNKEDIQKFWDELIIDKKKQSLYPTCFIFDKNGKLVQPEALRPPDEAALYAQIEKYL